MGAHEKLIEKCYMLQEFSATVGPWLSEESRLTYLRILSVNKDRKKKHFVTSRSLKKACEQCPKQLWA